MDREGLSMDFRSYFNAEAQRRKDAQSCFDRINRIYRIENDDNPNNPANPVEKVYTLEKSLRSSAPLRLCVKIPL